MVIFHAPPQWIALATFGPTVAALVTHRINKLYRAMRIRPLSSAAVPSIGAERPQWIGAGGAISRTEAGAEGRDSNCGDGCYQHDRVRGVHVKQ